MHVCVCIVISKNANNILIVMHTYPSARVPLSKVDIDHNDDEYTENSMEIPYLRCFLVSQASFFLTPARRVTVNYIILSRLGNNDNCYHSYWLCD